MENWIGNNRQEKVTKDTRFFFDGAIQRHDCDTRNFCLQRLLYTSTQIKFIRKINEGNLALPLVCIEMSQKSAKGIHLLDLA